MSARGGMACHVRCIVSSLCVLGGESAEGRCDGSSVSDGAEAVGTAKCRGSGEGRGDVLGAKALTSHTGVRAGTCPPDPGAATRVRNTWPHLGGRRVRMQARMARWFDWRPAMVTAMWARSRCYTLRMGSVGDCL